jgi:hypothetical protein
MGLDEPVECVCIVGRDLKDWSTAQEKKESDDMFAAKKARVVKYEHLLRNARESYREYLDHDGEVGRIREILDSLGEVAK